MHEALPEGQGSRVVHHGGLPAIRQPEVVHKRVALAIAAPKDRGLRSTSEDQFLCGELAPALAGGTVVAEDRASGQVR